VAEAAEFAVVFDGVFAFDVGSPIPLEQGWQRQRTPARGARHDGFDTHTITDVSARFGAGRLEYLHELDGGHVVLLATADGFGVRDRDSTWFCGREAPTCARS
jgi:hypothetical protein